MMKDFRDGVHPGNQLRFIIMVSLCALLAGASWLVWQLHGDHELVPVTNLWIASALGLGNIALAWWSVSREPFASFLLLGATAVSQILTIVFLYLV